MSLLTSFNRRASSSKAIAIAVTLALLAGCNRNSSSVSTAPSPPTSASPAPATANLYKGIAAAAPTNSSIGAVAVSEGGEKFGVATQTNSGGELVRVTGGTLMLPDGNSAVVLAGEDGLPSRAVFGDAVVQFSNYTSNSVDVTVVSGSSTPIVARGVKVNATLLAELRSMSDQLRGVSTGGDRTSFTWSSVGSILKYGGKLIGAAGCIAGIGSIIASGGLSAVAITMIGASCLSTLVDVLTLINPSADSGALQAAQYLVAALGCKGDNTYDCAQFLAQTFEFVISKAANDEPLPQPPPGPTAPVINVVTPSNPKVSSSAQNLGIGGSGFASGLWVTLTAPSGINTTISGSQIQNVTAGSFQVAVTLPSSGSYSLRVNNPNGQQSSSFGFGVSGAIPQPPQPPQTSVTLSGSAACKSGSPVIQLSFSVAGATPTTFDVHRNGNLLSSGNSGTTFDNTSVTAGSSYSYSVVVRLSNGSTVTSSTVNVAIPAGVCGATSPTPPAPPAPPTPPAPPAPTPPPAPPAPPTPPATPTASLSGSAICKSGSPAIRLSVNGSNGTISSFDVIRNGSLMASGITGSSFDDSPVTAGSTYTYFVTVRFTSGATATSSAVGVFVQGNVCGSVSSTVNITGSAYCKNGTPAIALSFTLSSGSISTFDLFRNGSLLYPANTGSTFDNYPVTPGSTYTYYVVVRLTNGSTATSQTVSITVGSNLCATAPTVTLSGSAYCRNGSTPAINLSFSVTGATPKTFDIYRNGSLLYPSNTGTTFDNYPVTAGATYSYYVEVDFTNGTSATSKTINLSVPANVCGSPPAVTVNLSGGAFCRSGSPAISLAFTVSGGTSSTFDIHRNGNLLYPANTGSTFLNYPLTAGATYSYYFVVHLSTGGTKTSNTVTITVPAGICPEADGPLGHYLSEGSSLTQADFTDFARPAARESRR